MTWWQWTILVLAAVAVLGIGALAFLARYMSDRPGGGQW